uniref:Uncharacterized protein n=1 Tax=Panagrolaimus sp. PS1159 TaxID=55785 RepID=A0AC35GIN1_9BILA
MKKRSSKAHHSHSSSERGDYGIDSSTASGLPSIYGSNAMLARDFQTAKPFVGLPRQPCDVGTDSYHPNQSNNWWF